MTEPTFAYGRHPLLAPLLVGRAREQVLLREHLTGAPAGGGSLVLIGGEAGIGTPQPWLKPGRIPSAAID